MPASEGGTLDLGVESGLGDDKPEEGARPWEASELAAWPPRLAAPPPPPPPLWELAFFCLTMQPR